MTHQELESEVARLNRNLNDHSDNLYWITLESNGIDVELVLMNDRAPIAYGDEAKIAVFNITLED